MQARRSCVTPLLCDAGAVRVVAVLKLQTPVPLASASLGVLCCHHLTSLDPSTTSNGVEIIMEYYHFRMLDRPCCNIHARAHTHTHTHTLDIGTGLASIARIGGRGAGGRAGGRP